MAIDHPDPQGLAAFREEPLGMTRVQDDQSFVVISDDLGTAGEKVLGATRP